MKKFLVIAVGLTLLFSACSDSNSDSELYFSSPSPTAHLTVKADGYLSISKIYLVKKGDRNDWDKRIELLGILDEPLASWDHLTWEIVQGDYVGYATFDMHNGPDKEVS